MIYEQHVGRFMHIQILALSSLRCSGSPSSSPLMNCKMCVITQSITPIMLGISTQFIGGL